MTDGIFTMKIDPETESNLETLAKEDDRSKSAVIRHLVNTEFKKRIICVQHDGGRREVDPEAK